MKFFTLVTCLYSFSLFSCEINFPEKILNLETESSLSAHFVQNCGLDRLSQIISFMRNAEGKISLNQIKTYLPGDINIKANSAKIEFLKLSDVVKQNFSSASDASIEFFTPFTQSNFLGFSSKEDLNMKCDPCEFTSFEEISFRGQSSQINLKAKISKMVEAYKVVKKIPAFSMDLSSDYFIKVQIPASNYKKPFTKMTLLPFYKTNKTLKPGTILNMSDLTPLSLVKAGDKTEVVFESRNVRILSSAISRQAGGLEEFIEVYNPKTQKKHNGKIIDYKKVLVEL